MRLASRVNRLREKVGIARKRPVVIVWSGRDEAMWRERAERGVKNGQPIHLIRIGCRRLNEVKGDLKEGLLEMAVELPDGGIAPLAEGVGAGREPSLDQGLPAWLIRAMRGGADGVDEQEEEASSER